MSHYVSNAANENLFPFIDLIQINKLRLKFKVHSRIRLYQDIIFRRLSFYLNSSKLSSILVQGIFKQLHVKLREMVMLITQTFHPCFTIFFPAHHPRFHGEITGNRRGAKWTRRHGHVSSYFYLVCTVHRKRNVTKFRSFCRL